MPADAESAAEFRYRNPVVDPDTLYFAVSQSGETIDTLLAVQELQRKGCTVLGVVNKVGSAIARETGRTIEAVLEDIDRDRWLDAQEAIDYGLVSRIISHKSELG